MKTINFTKSHDGVYETQEAGQEKIERAIRPVTCIYIIAFGVMSFLLFQWRDGKVEMEPYLAIATIALAAIGGLSLWAFARLYRTLR